MKKAYWSYKIGEDNNQFPPEFYEPPKLYKSGYDMRYDHAKCPAWKKWTDNTWMVTQPFDLGFKFKDKTIESNLTQAAYDDYFMLGDNWLNGQYPEIQMKYAMSVWTKDKDVWIEQIPHPLLSRYGLELIPATFPISVWFRPMVIGVKMLDSDIYLPKGTPLYYFRLYSKRSDSDFQLQQRDVPKDVWRQLEQNNKLREFTRFNAWDIIRERLNKEGKCPFRWN